MRILDFLSATTIHSLGNHRLMEFRSELAGGWLEVSNLIDSCQIDTLWWPDSNIAILNESAEVWKAFRVKSFNDGCPACWFTGTVIHELTEWLDDPFRNKDRARDIRSALSQNTWASGISLNPDDPVTISTLSYMLLTGQFRNLGRTLNGENFFGVDLTTTDLQNRIIGHFGETLFKIAKKGRTDSKRGRNPNFNDDLNCAMITLISIIQRRDSIILTTDRDLFASLKILHELLRIHYLSSCLAKRFNELRHHKIEHGPESEIDHYFNGPIEFYTCPQPIFSYLPASPETVTISVLYISPKGKLEIRGYVFEAEMGDVIRYRGITNGVSASLHDGRSVHAKPPRVISNHIVVGHDKFVNATSTIAPHTFNLRISMADTMNAVGFVQENLLD